MGGCTGSYVVTGVGSGRLLQLKLLSAAGEVLTCVNCPHGQITVMRSHRVSDLKPYQRALAGIPGPERFSITIDGAPFYPDQHVFIGFGEHFFSDDGTLSDFLRKSGVPDDSLDSVLLSFGLERRAEVLCSALTECEERRARLVAAMHARGKAIVLNEPFEVLASQWKERLAEYLLEQMKVSARFVVVTGLSYRPECWIDEPLISKVMVGESVQRTIGFGSGESEASPMIQQLRQAHRPSPQIPPPQAAQSPAAGSLTQASSMSHPAPVRQEAFESFAPVQPAAGRTPPPFRSKTRFMAGVSLGVCIAVLAGSGLIVFKNEQSTTTPTVVPEPVPEQAQPESEPPVTEELPVSPEEFLAPVQEQTQYVLDDYNPEIRQAVIESFEGAEQSGSSVPTAEQDDSAASENLFTMLQDASSTGKAKPSEESDTEDPSDAGEPDSEDSSAQVAPSDENAKRELIRQKFLEAIQNAAERRKLTMPADTLE